MVNKNRLTQSNQKIKTYKIISNNNKLAKIISNNHAFTHIITIMDSVSRLAVLQPHYWITGTTWPLTKSSIN